MVPLAYTERPIAGCADLLTLAQRELASFYAAVKNLFGADEAARAALDWLDELNHQPSLPASPSDYRHITLRAAATLSNRVPHLSRSSKGGGFC